MIRVLLAHPQSLIRDGLASLLRGELGFTLVAAASDGPLSLALIERFDPDVAVIDTSLPQLTGLEVARAVSERKLHTRVLILAASDESLSLRERFADGVWGTIAKSRNREELLAAIRAAASGKPLAGPPAPKRARLSPRERDTLRLLAEGMTSRQIAEHLSIGTATISTYRLALMEKLGIRHLAGLVKYAIRNRYTSLDD